jgi:hypothetical protein
MQKQMQNTQNLPPRPFQEAQAEIPKDNKKLVSTKSNQKNKKTPKHLPSESLTKSDPGFLKKRRNFD